MSTFLHVLAILPAILTFSICFEWNKHHDNKEMLEIMQDVHDRCPDNTRLYSLPQVKHTDVPEQTQMGEKLWVIEFAEMPGEHVEGIPEFKYIGNMHGNEVVGRELLLMLMDYLCAVSRGDVVQHSESNQFDRKKILWLLQNTRIHIMPSMNPDGWTLAAASGNGSYQNGVKDWLEGRANANGVDLNRNFPDLNKIYYKIKGSPNHVNNHIDEHFEAIASVNKLDPEKTLKLEPETKMVMTWLHSIPFVTSANLHNGDIVANYPFDETEDGSPHKYTKSPDDETFKEMARSYSEEHRVMASPHEPCEKMEGKFEDGITNGAAWYSVPGGMQDYNYLSTNCFEITLELGCDKFPPASQLLTLWDDNKESLFNFMFQAHIGIKGEIKLPHELRDMDLLATIHVRNENSGVDIDHDILSTEYGDYFRLLADGMYTVNATVYIPHRKGYLVPIVRQTCINVENKPTELNEAQIVNFDFRDLSQEFDGLSCEGMQYERDQDYYNIISFFRQLAGKNRFK